MPDRKPVAMFRALSHETRVKILELLGRADELGLRSGEIANHLSIAPSTTSYHLFILRKMGLVIRRNAGKERRYLLNSARTNSLAAFLNWAREPR